MKASSRILADLDRRLPKPAEPTDEVEALRRRALIEQNVAHVRLADVRDPWTKQLIRNEAERQLGLRRG